jgi:hypothetical protein
MALEYLDLITGSSRIDRRAESCDAGADDDNLACTLRHANAGISLGQR